MTRTLEVRMEANGALTFSQGFFLTRREVKSASSTFGCLTDCYPLQVLEGSQIVGVTGANDAHKRTL